MVCPNPHRISGISTPTRFLMRCLRLQFLLNIQHSSLVRTQTLMRPCGGLSGSPSDAAFASHTRLLGARVWLVNFSSKFNVPAGLIKCLPPIPARRCFCLSSLRSSPQSSTPILFSLLSRSLSNGWVAILRRLSSPITLDAWFPVLPSKILAKLFKHNHIGICRF